MSTEPRTEHAGIWKEFLDNGGEFPAVNLLAKQCQTCNGHGEIGSLQTYGYDGETCPDCNGSGNEATE